MQRPNNIRRCIKFVYSWENNEMQDIEWHIAPNERQLSEVDKGSSRNLGVYQLNFKAKACQELREDN